MTAPSRSCRSMVKATHLSRRSTAQAAASSSFSICHARVQEGVAKSQFPLKGSGFQKSKPHICEVLKGFIPTCTLAWCEVCKIILILLKYITFFYLTNDPNCTTRFASSPYKSLLQMSFPPSFSLHIYHTASGDKPPVGTAGVTLHKTIPICIQEDTVGCSFSQTGVHKGVKLLFVASDLPSTRGYESGQNQTPGLHT